MIPTCSMFFTKCGTSTEAHSSMIAEHFIPQSEWIFSLHSDFHHQMCMHCSYSKLDCLLFLSLTLLNYQVQTFSVCLFALY